MKKILLALLVAIAVPVTAGIAGLRPGTPAESQNEFVFGRWMKDPFRWMENRDNPRLYSWIRNQNQHTRDTLSGPEFDELKGEFKKIYGGESELLPPTDDFEEMLKLDRRAPAPGRGASMRSPDGTFEIQSLADNNADFKVVRIYDAANKIYLKDYLLLKFPSFIWEDGNTSFIYQSDFDGRMGNAFPGIYRHRVGTSQMVDELIYEAPTTDTWISIDFVSGKWILEEARNEVSSVSEFDINTRTRRVIRSGLKNRFSTIEVTSDEIFAISDSNKDMGEVVSINIATGELKTIIPASDIHLESAVKADSEILVAYIRDTASEVVLYKLETKAEQKITVPGLGRAQLSFDGDKFNLTWTSYTESKSYWTLNKETSAFDFVKRDAALPLELEAERIFYVAHNGIKAPIWVIKKKGLVLTPQTPAYLYGYGGFAVNILPSASREITPWLKRGGIFAVATLPGGLEYGEAWHRAGMLHNKKNVFRDFAMAGSTLVSLGMTSHERLAIGGASNGGTLVGSTMNLYPTLFKAAVPAVGVMDMTMFKEHTGGKWWISEYGDSAVKEDFDYMMKYSPYHIIRNDKLPHTLVLTGDMDDRVVPSHSYKFAAMLQAQKGNPSQALIYTQRNASHGSTTGAPKDVVETMTVKWSFVLNATSGKFDK